MNNKGFTLIEIIAVIAILGVVGIIATISLQDTLNETKKMHCEEFLKEVEEAACTYASLTEQEVKCTRNSCTPLPLKVLIARGLVTAETNECNGKKVNENDTVTVTWDASGKKTCTFNGDIGTYQRGS